MSRSKKIFPLIFCATLLISAFPICCSEDFYPEFEVEQEGPGKKYYAAKMFLQLSGSAASFYGGYQDPENMTPANLIGLTLNLCAWAMPFLFRKNLKQIHFGKGAVLNAFMFVGNLYLDSAFSTAGGQWRDADTEIGVNIEKEKNKSVGNVVLGIILRTICAAANEYGASLMEEKNGMKVRVKLSPKLKNLRCPNCDHEINLSEVAKNKKNK